MTRTQQLINEALQQPTAADAYIYFETAYKLHKLQQPIEPTEDKTLNLELLTPSTLTVKELLTETETPVS